MPWLIQHKCNISQSDLSEYAVVKLTRDGQPFTKIECGSPDCGEEFVLVGHEMFDEAVEVNQASGSGSPADPSSYDLPPGFVIPRSRRA
jgi:hypothetical protein